MSIKLGNGGFESALKSIRAALSTHEQNPFHLIDQVRVSALTVRGDSKMLRPAKVLSERSAIVRIARSASILGVLAIAVAHCTYDWDIPSTSSALDSDDGSSYADGSTSSDSAIKDDAFANDAGDSGSSNARQDADAEVDANLPIVDIDASCSPSVRCASGSYCRYADQECGAGDKAGVCTSNQSCAITSPGATSVCSCSGAVYPSACAARSDGQDVSATAMCSAPASNFQCGYAFCPTSDFCIANAPTDGGADTFGCQTMNGCVLGCGCSAPAAAKTACDGGCAGAILDLTATEVTCH